MNARIIADSSSDILEMDGIDFRSAPLTVSTDERSFVDDKALDLDEMLTYLAEYRGRSFTACPNINDWLAAYGGAEELYVVTITSALSGSYNAAKAAAGLYTEKYPEAKIHVFDSLSTGPEIRLILDKLTALVALGRPFEEIVSEVGEYRKHLRLFVALESFRNLANNGRVSKAVARVAGVLGIRIMATAGPEGTIETMCKCQGERGVLKKYMEYLEAAGYRGGLAYISHCKNRALAESLRVQILTFFPNAKVLVYETGGLCSYYAEKGGLLLGCECTRVYG